MVTMNVLALTGSTARDTITIVNKKRGKQSPEHDPSGFSVVSSCKAMLVSMISKYQYIGIAAENQSLEQSVSSP